MRVRAAQQGRRRPPPEVSCYGKLPCDREFLRFGIDSAVGRWVVETIDAAHDAIIRSGGRIAADREVRVLTFLPDAPGTLVAMLVREGADSTRSRRYPTALFSCHDAGTWSGATHLLPVCFAPMWLSLAKLMENPGATRDVFSLRLKSVTEGPDDLQYARARFDELIAMPLKRPWHALVNSGEEGASAAAAAIAHLPLSGPAVVRVRGTGSGALATLADAALLSAVWLRVLTASGGSRPWMAAVETWGRGEPRWQELYVFIDRALGSADLIHLLSGLGSIGVRDIAGPADGEIEEPPHPGEPSRPPAMGEHASCLGDLWRAQAGGTKGLP